MQGQRNTSSSQNEKVGQKIFKVNHTFGKTVFKKKKGTKKVVKICIYLDLDLTGFCLMYVERKQLCYIRHSYVKDRPKKV